jgi:asparagine synthase (glutamine-hydrolysing)
LLSSFQSDTFAWQGLLGTHVILIRKDGKLYVFADGLGACKIYANQDHSLWSNSFLAMLEVTNSKAFDSQACYEYVTRGAVFGNKTLVDGIQTLPANAILAIDGENKQILQRPSPIENNSPETGATLQQITEDHCKRLSKVFAPIAENYGDRIRLSFSGGFDSRLMLAMLMKHGAKPALFVYGGPDDQDVQIARLITEAEGLPLEHIDKSTVPAPDPEAFIGETEKNLFAFDGWKVESPLFDFGEDRRDRAKRHLDGQIPLNGSLGEIYRNFFYMPNRPSSTEAVVSTFYSRYDPKAFTNKFDERRYRSAMKTAMREAIGADSDQLHRSQVEELYPKFRGRFWTGRDAQINQRFGPMFFPFLEHAAISNTAKIPMSFKNLGYLQGRMIGQINSRLANYPSDYGFALDGPRPPKYRLKTFLGTQRPPALRKLSFRLTHRRMQPRTGPLSPEYLSQVIDIDFPIMRALFNLDAVNSASQFGLIATLEYLGQRYNLSVADD